MSMRQRVARAVRGLLIRQLPLMITCKELEEFILDYLDGTLPWRQRFIFNLHLLICRECRSYLKAYRRAVGLGQAVFRDPNAPIPDDVPEELVQAILAARRHQR